MARRGVGYSSLQRHLDSANSYSTLSTSLAEQQTAALSQQLATFQASLASFSTHHRAKILSSPSFRSHFSQLCAELGVDPLGGGAKGIWDKMGVGDWYYALGVQIVDVCLRARERGGGMVALDEVIQQVTILRRGGPNAGLNGKSSTSGGKAIKPPPSAEISPSDVARAIDALAPLHCGYKIITVGGKQVVRCYPGGLDRDSLIVVEAAGEQGTGRGAVSMHEVHAFTRREGGEGWTMERVERAVEKAMMDDGMMWVDEQAGGGREYFVPALFEFVEGQ
ncbi:vacuolar-sorting protein SNF8 [Leucosporidium creatinivorum]|uniref:Vacuolar-sorting protein SNF8 n=1 Tax=Leucosporidium creatinivorum TaxID=106004 RepID=A0A1Y2FHU5_9BASI|nr:vacuolar-sorting protein SNF8 [Leucosporidium creatinivorum]